MTVKFFCRPVKKRCLNEHSAFCKHLSLQKLSCTTLEFKGTMSENQKTI
jgi:hypothetical protein